MEDGMFAYGKRKKGKKLVFKATHRLQLLPLKLEKRIPSYYQLNLTRGRGCDLKGYVFGRRH